MIVLIRLDRVEVDCLVPYLWPESDLYKRMYKMLSKFLHSHGLRKSGEAICFRRAEYLIGRDHAAGPGHVFYHHRGVAGDMFANMARDRAAVDVESAAGARSHH